MRTTLQITSHYSIGYYILSNDWQVLTDIFSATASSEWKRERKEEEEEEEKIDQ